MCRDNSLLPWGPFAPARTPLRSGRSLLAAVALGFLGCAFCEYSPPLLPHFMEEETSGPAGILREDARAVLGTPVNDLGSLPEPGTLVPCGFTLGEVIRACLEADPRIQAGAETITQAQGDLWTAALPPNPTVTTSGSFLPLTRPFTVDQQGGPTQFDVGIGIPIDWILGKRATASTGARMGVDVAAANFADLVRQRVAATVAAFYDVLEAKALLELALRDRELLRRLEAINKERLRAGAASAIEEDRIRLAALDAERELRRREAGLVTAKAALQALIGRRSCDPAFDVAGCLATPHPVPPPPAEKVWHLAEQYRPDMVALRLQLAKTSADVRAEQAKARPGITPRIGYTRQFQEHMNGFPDASSWNVGVDVTLPVFDRKQGSICKAHSVFLQAHHNLQAQLVQLHADVEQAQQEFSVAYHAVTDEGPVRIKAAEGIKKRIEAAFKAGEATFNEMLEAERDYRDALRTYIQDQSAYWHALHKLNATIGKQILP